MFGAMGFQSNIAIQDAPHIDGEIVTKSVPELYRPRQRRGMRDVPGRKFYMHGEVASGETPIEACEKDSKFRFTVQIDNLTQAEWGLFFTALGHHPDHPFKLKIGGIKPACFGSIDCQIEQIQVEEQTREPIPELGYAIGIRKDWRAIGGVEARMHQFSYGIAHQAGATDETCSNSSPSQ